MFLAGTPEFLKDDASAFLPRVTVNDARAIEAAMAGQDLWQSGVELRGAVVEASFARTDPPLLRRLAEGGVPYLIDPQTLRFATPTFTEVAQIRSLPYAPSHAVGPGLKDSELDTLIRGSLSFQQNAGAAAFVAPALPLPDDDADAWLELHWRLLRATSALNGRAGYERKPLLAFVAPGRRISMNPEGLLDGLADLPLAGVYVQPLRLNPTGDSVEKLVMYVRLLSQIRELGLPVIAGRVGSFGLLLQALGIGLFDSGLGDAERFDFASLVRPRTPDPSDKSAARGDRRIYLERLKTTLRGRHAIAILSDKNLRSNFVCNLGCCRYRGFEDLPDRRRQHYLWVRNTEVNEVTAQATRDFRLEHVSEQLVHARETASVVTRALEEGETGAPSFDHLDRWGGVLARLTSSTVEGALRLRANVGSG